MSPDKFEQRALEGGGQVQLQPSPPPSPTDYDYDVETNSPAAAYEEVLAVRRLGYDEDGYEKGPIDQPWPVDHSCCYFGPTHHFRLFCRELVADPRFDQTIVIAIVISSICLALDVPRLDEESLLHAMLHYLDYFWTLLFFGEMMSKVG